MNNVTPVGLDVVKNPFSPHGVHTSAAALFRKAIGRAMRTPPHGCRLHFGPAAQQPAPNAE